MSDSVFWSQYKSPQWQKKRLEAMEAAGFICRICGDNDSQLHVHHKRYVKGRKIWEYDLSELSVLCETCHEEAHFQKEVLNDLLSRVDPVGMRDVISMLVGYCHHSHGPSHADAPDILEGFCCPHSSAIGRLAAEIEWKRSVQQINELADQIAASESTLEKGRD